MLMPVKCNMDSESSDYVDTNLTEEYSVPVTDGHEILCKDKPRLGHSEGSEMRVDEDTHDVFLGELTSQSTIRSDESCVAEIKPATACIIKHETIEESDVAGIKPATAGLITHEVIDGSAEHDEVIPHGITIHRAIRSPEIDLPEKKAADNAESVGEITWKIHEGLSRTRCLDTIFETGFRVAIKIRLPHEGRTVWLSEDRNNLFVGGDKSGMISVVQECGETVHNMQLVVVSSVSHIRSGLCLSGNEHVVILFYQSKAKELWKSRLFHIKIETKIGKLELIAEIKIEAAAIAFDYSHDNIAVYCEKNETNKRRIEVRNRGTIDITRTIFLEYHQTKTPRYITDVLRTESGEFLLSDLNNNIVHKYSRNGDFVESMGTDSNICQEIVMRYPCNIFRSDHGFVVACWDGSIIRLNKEQWECVKLGGQIKALAFDETQVYTVWEHDVTIFSLRKRVSLKATETM